MTRFNIRNLGKTAAALGAIVVATAFVSPREASAQYGYNSHYGRGAHGYHSSYSPFSLSYHSRLPITNSHRGHYHWHDTSHYDWHDTSHWDRVGNRYYWHRDGHYDFHPQGHWDYHRGHYGHHH